MSTRLVPDASRSLIGGILAGACLLLMLLPVAAIPAQVPPLMGTAESADTAEATDELSSNAGTWTRKAPATSPSSRSRHMMVYDPPTRKVVLFGGTSGGGETWVYDTAGDAWTRKMPSMSPGARNAHAMAYDTKRNLVLMNGGSSGGAETWTYDATADMWMNKNPTGAPAARTDAKMVYEPVTDRFFLFGGRTSAGRTDDMYAYDPTNNSWTALPLPSKPTPRHRHAMALDPVARKIVLQGGCIEDNCASQFSDETWHLDPTAAGWTMANPSSNPGQRDDHTLIWDAKNSKLLTCCGYVGGTGANSDVWEYQSSGPTWTMATVGATKPSGRYSYDWAWDAGQGVAVLFGGTTGGAETWVYDPGGGGGVAPTVGATSPADLATNVAVNSNIEITFSVPMDTVATQAAISSSPTITGTFSWTNGDATVTWNPGTDLTVSTLHTVTISTAAKSKAGVAMAAAKSFSFTTAAGGGNTPSVTVTAPTNAATSVPLTTNIDITFSTAMDKTATEPAITVAPTAAGSVTWGMSDTMYTFNPTVDLTATTTYTVTTSTAAKSSTGQSLPSVHTFSFTTGTGTAPTPPKVTGNTPVSDATNVPVNTNIAIDFDMAMNKVDTEAAVSVTPNPPNQGTWTWSNGDKTVTIDPDGDLLASTEYNFMVGTGAKSAQGVALPAMHMFKFTTGSASDSAFPQIVHQVPGQVDEGTSVAIIAKVTDDTSVATVTLHYRAAGDPLFTKAPMAAGSNDEYKATIPAAAVKPTKVEYYIEAVDGAAKKTIDPTGAPTSVHTVVVNKKGDGGPGPTSPAGIFGMGSTMDLIIIGVIIAVVVAAVVAMMMMKRKKKGQAGPAAGPYQQGYGQQQWASPPQPGGPSQGQWQPPPQGGQGGWG